MNLDEFLYALHFDVDHVRPPDWEADYNDAPLAYKLYLGLPTFPLSLEIPFTWEQGEPNTGTKQEGQPDRLAAQSAGAIVEGPGNGALGPDLVQIGHFLWYAYGITQLSQSVLPAEGGDTTILQYRRFAPSGGGLYPSELYAYLKVRGLPHGVYHYDAAHHRLVLLREGNYDTFLEQALGDQCDVSACFGVLLVTTMFWKNFFKYNSFAYRLQGLDAGVLIGQIVELAKRCGFSTCVFFEFLDRALNHVLGLSGEEESVYSAISLSASSKQSPPQRIANEVCATKLVEGLPPIQTKYYVKSRNIKPYPLLIRMNEASMLETINASENLPKIAMGELDGGVGCDSHINLPSPGPSLYDFASACKKRYSPGADFVLKSVSLAHLSTLLAVTVSAHPFVVEGGEYQGECEDGGLNQRLGENLSLYVSLYGVEDVPDGAYWYDEEAHALRLIRPGDHRFYLQQGMTMHNVNLSQVPMCFHIVGDVQHLKQRFGYRGYRIQHMQAGIVVQRLLLAASALDMGGHPLLGFESEWCDKLYNLPNRGLTSLIQVPVGYYNRGSKLDGGIHA